MISAKKDTSLRDDPQHGSESRDVRLTRSAAVASQAASAAPLPIS
jgi:hypothetical protein